MAYAQICLFVGKTGPENMTQQNGIKDEKVVEKKRIIHLVNLRKVICQLTEDVAIPVFYWPTSP